MPESAMTNDIQQCIDECLNCYRTCLHTAMNHCLQMGGRHIEPEHFTLMMNCAEICRTSADFMLTGSPLHSRTCAVCAEVCEACADSCEQIGDMDECMQACRTCAQSCHQIAGGGGRIGMGVQGQATGASTGVSQ